MWFTVLRLVKTKRRRRTRARFGVCVQATPQPPAPPFLWAILITLVACNWGSLGRAQELVNREYVIKAAYLHNFGRYVRWPADAFGDAQAPFTIGVLDPDPIGKHLRAVAQSRKIDERDILIRRFSYPDDVLPCHILFFARDVDSDVRRKVIARLSGKHVLSVGEADTFLNEGGVIDLVIRENHVELNVSMKAAHREGLQISSKLLQLARVQE